MGVVAKSLLFGSKLGPLLFVKLPLDRKQMIVKRKGPDCETRAAPGSLPFRDRALQCYPPLLDIDSVSQHRVGS